MKQNGETKKKNAFAITRKSSGACEYLLYLPRMIVGKGIIVIVMEIGVSLLVNTFCLRENPRRNRQGTRLARTNSVVHISYMESKRTPFFVFFRSIGMHPPRLPV